MAALGLSPTCAASTQEPAYIHESELPFRLKDHSCTQDVDPFACSGLEPHTPPTVGTQKFGTILLLLLSQTCPSSETEDPNPDPRLMEGVVLCTVLPQHVSFPVSRVSGGQTQPYLPLGARRGAEDRGEGASPRRPLFRLGDSI